MPEQFNKGKKSRKTVYFHKVWGLNKHYVIFQLKRIYLCCHLLSILVLPPVSQSKTNLGIFRNCFWLLIRCSCIFTVKRHVRDNLFHPSTALVMLYQHCSYIPSYITAWDMTLDSPPVLLCLPDAGSLWERGQLAVEQLSVDRSGTGQVSWPETGHWCGFTQTYFLDSL